MMTVAECLKSASARLAASGVPNERMEARLLLAHAAGWDVTALLAYPERRVDCPDSFFELITRRQNREPISHITGSKEFWSLPFLVTRDTLVPRPDSETLVEAAVRFFDDKPGPRTVLDLGTGTGCLLLSVLSEFPDATGIGVDASAAAAAVAQRNALRLHLAGRASFVVSDWAAALKMEFDLIISNPPYIPSREIDGLSDEVAKYEPRKALDGGDDGLNAYRRILDVLPACLSEKGVAVFEFGFDQGAEIQRLIDDAGFSSGPAIRDLAGHERCLLCWKGR